MGWERILQFVKLGIVSLLLASSMRDPYPIMTVLSMVLNVGGTVWSLSSVSTEARETVREALDRVRKHEVNSSRSPPSVPSSIFFQAKTLPSSLGILFPIHCCRFSAIIREDEQRHSQISVDETKQRYFFGRIYHGGAENSSRRGGP